ncbi:hypothetical protein VNO77_25004 [Canavalia gladiata]|uniref:Uncharacterized protein n=1 Tax=Canavalia gladiata TaxID=3824 RepID=A0AAN9LAR5_CANGL
MQLCGCLSCFCLSHFSIILEAVESNGLSRNLSENKKPHPKGEAPVSDVLRVILSGTFTFAVSQSRNSNLAVLHSLFFLFIHFPYPLLSDSEFVERKSDFLIQPNLGLGIPIPNFLFYPIPYPFTFLSSRQNFPSLSLSLSLSLLQVRTITHPSSSPRSTFSET